MKIVEKEATVEKVSKQDVLIRLKALKKEIAMRFRVKELELFGSVVREEHKDISDIDVLVINSN